MSVQAGRLKKENISIKINGEDRDRWIHDIDESVYKIGRKLLPINTSRNVPIETSFSPKLSRHTPNTFEEEKDPDYFTIVEGLNYLLDLVLDLTQKADTPFYLSRNNFSAVIEGESRGCSHGILSTSIYEVFQKTQPIISALKVKYHIVGSENRKIDLLTQLSFKMGVCFRTKEVTFQDKRVIKKELIKLCDSIPKSMDSTNYSRYSNAVYRKALLLEDS